MDERISQGCQNINKFQLYLLSILDQIIFVSFIMELQDLRIRNLLTEAVMLHYTSYFWTFSGQVKNIKEKVDVSLLKSTIKRHIRVLLIQMIYIFTNLVQITGNVQEQESWTD